MHKCRISYDHSHAAHNAARNKYATLTNDGITIDIYQSDLFYSSVDDRHTHRLALPKTHANEVTEALFFHEDSTIACLKRHLNAQNQTVHTLYSFDLTQASRTPNTCSNMPLIAAWAYLSREQPQIIRTMNAQAIKEKCPQPTREQLARTLKGLINT
jgi:hypothetical protein